MQVNLSQKCKKWNDDADFDAGDIGLDSWIREICFREFYRHMLIIKPHGSMNLPQNVKFDFVQWEEDDEDGAGGAQCAQQ